MSAPPSIPADPGPPVLKGVDEGEHASLLATRLPALDGLRGIAILLVMIFHYEVRYWPYRSGLGTPLWAVIREGWLGVDLFFVLSGFLITGILLDTKLRPGYFRTFYARRALRIFPLYYAYLFVAFFIVPALHLGAGSQAGTPFAVQVWFWSYLSDFLIGVAGWGASPNSVSHFWSLAVEEQFYLVWPAVVLFCSRRTLVVVCATVVAGAVAFRVGFRVAPATWVPIVLPFARVDGLAAGALVALAIRAPNGLAVAVRLARPAVVAAATAVLLLFAWRGFVDTQDVIVGTVGLTACVLFFASLVAVAVTERQAGWVHRVLTLKALTQVGKYSYAMYVFHAAVRVGLDGMGLSLEALTAAIGRQSIAHIVHILANALGTFGIAALSWHVFESRFNRLKDRFGYAKDVPGRPVPLATEQGDAPAALARDRIDPSDARREIQ